MMTQAYGSEADIFSLLKQEAEDEDCSVSSPDGSTYTSMSESIRLRDNSSASPRGSPRESTPIDAKDTNDTEKESAKDEDDDAKHNKYCHFCQHVKLRASAMLACSNKGCSRRFCEHCLVTQLGENVDPTSSAFEDGAWKCPICRKLCCCALQSCNNSHRHCKAYRYRRRRAEISAKKQNQNGALAEKEARVRMLQGGGYGVHEPGSCFDPPEQRSMYRMHAAASEQADCGAMYRQSSMEVMGRNASSFFQHTNTHPSHLSSPSDACCPGGGGGGGGFYGGQPGHMMFDQSSSGVGGGGGAPPRQRSRHGSYSDGTPPYSPHAHQMMNPGGEFNFYCLK